MTLAAAGVRARHTLLRRLWHVAGGLLLLAPYASGTVGRRTYALVLALLLLGLLAVDLVRLRHPRTNELFVRTLSGLLLPRDLRGLNGTTYFAAGILLAVLLLPRLPAIVSVLFLVLGDIAAGVVGRAWGRTRFKPGGKSLEGSLACFVVCLAVATPLVGWLAAAGGALAAALVEYAEVPLDDNLLIPPVSGAVLLWLS
ncbi:MAG: diacylglycerol/polyprenol kinase family protein [Gemmatimonadota bacterium]